MTVNQTNIIKWLPWGVIAILLGINIFAIVKWQEKDDVQPDKIAFVVNQTLYEGFDLTKEMDKEITIVQEERQKILDSLKLSIQAFSSKVEIQNQNQEMLEKLERMQGQYVRLRNEFVKSNEELYARNFEEIWTQLNEYVQEYGKQNGFTYIHGAIGNGGLMYASDARDITKELIQYCNTKYQGG